MTHTLKQIITELNGKVHQTKTSLTQQALLSYIAEELIQDPTFIAGLQRHLNEYAVNSSSNRTSSKNRVRPGDIVLTPITHIEGAVLRIDSPPDIPLLLKMYGTEQLPLALSRFKVTTLREAARLLPSRKGALPDTKIELIDYLVRHASS
jgi:hypothetical protein